MAPSRCLALVPRYFYFQYIFFLLHEKFMSRHGSAEGSVSFAVQGQPVVSRKGSAVGSCKDTGQAQQQELYRSHCVRVGASRMPLRKTLNSGQGLATYVHNSVHEVDGSIAFASIQNGVQSYAPPQYDISLNWKCLRGWLAIVWGQFRWS